MMRKLAFVTLMVFACSSIFLLSSCAKKQVITEERQIKAAPKEAAKVEKAAPAVKETAQEKAAEATKEAEVKLEQLKAEEMAQKAAAEAKAEEEAMNRRAGQFEAEPIYFEFDKSFVKEDHRSTLNEKAQFLKDYPDVYIRIEGNCDERGTNEYNLALGERRADSAKLYIVRLGVSPKRIGTISYGEERPRAMGHSEDAWSQNRRDDFVIVKK